MGNERQFSLSAARNNENAKSQEAIFLSDTCVERIKEITDDTGYLRIMVIIIICDILSKYDDVHGVFS